ncbi:MAG: Hsp20/alpha crystallin family protein [Methanophagales archaeon ANME-1-THS]|nr:MAG: Hsp20/alpha crystallin family protein [Methanophagales archaeon ANME-1-THS]
MEKRKRPSIFDLLEWYMERIFEDLSNQPAVSRENFSRMAKKDQEDRGGWVGDPFEEMARKLEEGMPEELRGFMTEEKTPEGKVKRYGPFIYGFSYTKEPGKEPEIKEFGNIKASHRRIEPFPNGEREPLVDVIDHGDSYEVVAELPGVEKKDIKLHAADDTLEIRTENGRRYFKEVAFKTLVKPETAKATYKNGVLSVRIKKKAREIEKEKTAIPLE